ncbi:MAG: hypothetical protein QMD17_02395 [Rhodocyclaceae bacterium]|nr:hypothetical protein [Rhodocyclaceae bacterium]
MMASKPKKPAAPEAEKYPRKEITCKSGPSIDDQGRNYAKLITSPDLAAYRIIGLMQPKGLAENIDTPTMLETLRDQAAAVQGGDLTHAEAMLINQASALQALFVRLSEKAMQQEHMPNLEGFMRMALRSQSQCRATLETLAAIKNPPVIYAKQVNQTTGPQQINNGTPLQARRNENEPIEQARAGALLPDTGASSIDGRISVPLEAVGEIDRAKVARG